MDPLKPSPSLLSKLGSIVVHAEELLSPTGHHFDRAAMLTCVEDAEVVEWLKQMQKMALVPVKR